MCRIINTRNPQSKPQLNLISRKPDPNPQFFNSLVISVLYHAHINYTWYLVNSVRVCKTLIMVDNMLQYPYHTPTSSPFIFKSQENARKRRINLLIRVLYVLRNTHLSCYVKSALQPIHHSSFSSRRRHIRHNSVGISILVTEYSPHMDGVLPP